MLTLASIKHGPHGRTLSRKDHRDRTIWEGQEIDKALYLPSLSLSLSLSLALSVALFLITMLTLRVLTIEIVV